MDLYEKANEEFIAKIKAPPLLEENYPPQTGGNKTTRSPSLKR